MKLAILAQFSVNKINNTSNKIITIVKIDNLLILLNEISNIGNLIVIKLALLAIRQFWLKK